MVDDVIDTGPDALKKKRDELLLKTKTPEEPKLTSPDVYESAIETERLNKIEQARVKSELDTKRMEREADTARSLSQKYESQYKDIPEFKPTPESKNELMGLFGLIGAIGAFGGGKSYGSALGAMNAMTGMLKGYQEGRKDLYEREKAQFDKNLQSIKSHNDQITAAFNRAKDLAKTNLPMAERKLITELKAMDANVLATTLYTQGLEKTDKMRIETNNRINTQADQNLKTVAALDKAIKEQGNIYSDEAINNIVDRYIAGDPKALTGLGTGIAAQRERTRILTKISERMGERGATVEDIMIAQSRFAGLQAGERALAQSGARIGQAQQEALNLAKPALEISAKLDRSKFVPLNKLLQTAEANISDPDLLSFRATNNSFLTAYARALSPTGAPTDLVRRHAYELLITAFDQASYKRVMEQLKVEMEAALKAPDEMRNRLEKEFKVKIPAASGGSNIDDLLKKYEE
jgi:hypothetical protein